MLASETTAREGRHIHFLSDGVCSRGVSPVGTRAGSACWTFGHRLPVPKTAQPSPHGPMLRSPTRFLSTTSSLFTRRTLLSPHRSFSISSRMSAITYPKARRDEDHVEVYKSKKNGDVSVKDRESQVHLGQLERHPYDGSSVLPELNLARVGLCCDISSELAALHALDPLCSSSPLSLCFALDLPFPTPLAL